MNNLIIGLGNDYRSDDAVGRVVARKLRAESLDGVDILEETGEGAALIEAWRGADFVILIDAVHSVGEPGAIYRIDANEQQIPRVFFITRRTHSTSAKLLKWHAPSANCRADWSCMASKERICLGRRFNLCPRKGSGRDDAPRESRAIHEFSLISDLMRRIRAIAREPISSRARSAVVPSVTQVSLREMKDVVRLLLSQ